jgi:hypothetical protein
MEVIESDREQGIRIDLGIFGAGVKIIKFYAADSGLRLRFKKKNKLLQYSPGPCVTRSKSVNCWESI